METHELLLNFSISLSAEYIGKSFCHFPVPVALVLAILLFSILMNVCFKYFLPITLVLFDKQKCSHFYLYLLKDAASTLYIL